MSKEAHAEQAKERAKYQAQVVKQWKTFATTTGKVALDDLFRFIDETREMYRKYAEERAMPHPSKDGEVVPLDNETIASLLQNSRGLNIVKTYIEGRIAADVAQPTSKSK